jgi:hypothetical protein
MQPILLLTFLMFIFCGPAAAQTRSLSLSTYFPPPSSGFDRLQLIPRVTLGYSDNNIGNLYVSSSLPDTILSSQDCDLSDSANTAGCYHPMSGIWTQPDNNRVILTDSLLLQKKGSAPDRNANSIPDIDELKVIMGGINSPARLSLRAWDNTMLTDGGIVASGRKVDLSGSDPGGRALTTSGAGTRGL